MKQRNASVELLRILAMIMVIILHALGHGGVLNAYVFGQAGYYAAWLLESLCFVAVNCFVLITGYFMVTAQMKLSRLLKLMVQVWFYSALSLVAAKFVFHQQVGIKSIVYALFPLTGRQYWFASAYAVLLAVSSLLNKLIQSMDQKAHFRAICLLVVLFSVVPTFLFWGRKSLSQGYDFVWFVVLYFTAAYVRLYGFSLPVKKCILGYLLTALLGFASNIVLALVTKIVFGEPKLENLFFSYNSILFFIASVLLFVAFTKLQVQNKLLTKVSRLGSYVFGAYLISDHVLTAYPLWDAINLPAVAQNGNIVAVGTVVGIALLIVAVGCAVEFGRIYVMRTLKFDTLCLWADKMFQKYIGDKLQ